MKNIVFGVCLMISSLSLAEAQPMAVLDVDGGMTTEACKAFVDEVWQQSFKDYAPKPIFVNFSSERPQIESGLFLGGWQQLVFGVYVNNDFVGEDEKFRFDFQTSRLGFSHIPKLKTPKGAVSCHVIRMWRRNSSVIALNWIDVSLVGLDSAGTIVQKRILSE